jgi:hypothetical protein
MSLPDQGGGPLIEPPYDVIRDQLKRGKVIPFLGAGSSRITMPVPSSMPPSAIELASMLASYASLPSKDPNERADLAKVASYLVDASSRGALRDRLHEVFTKPFTCNPLHSLLAAVANKMVVVTTNYDTLLEEAFKAIGKPYDVVIYEKSCSAVQWWRHGNPNPELIKANAIDPKEIGRTNLIYKIHGSVKPDDDQADSFVITEEDYIQFLSQMSTAVPPAFSEYFGGRAFLFLGYGLKDWNMRVMLRQVRSPDITSWAIQLNPTVLEKKMWERRRIDIYDLSLEDFVAKLRTAAGL